jgi:hypothetical protein
MKKLIGLIAILAAILAAAPGAWAEEVEEDLITSTMEACEPEIETYCSQVTLGEGRLLACFYAHEDKLSARCGYALYTAAAELEQFAVALTHVASACLEDMEEFCGEVEIGEGRVGLCLLEHKDQVSEQCSQAMDDVGMEAGAE